MMDSVENGSTRPANYRDISSVKAIEIELNLSPWSERDYILELERDDSVFIVVEDQDCICGFILARLITNTRIGAPRSTAFCKDETTVEVEIFNIGILPTKQRTGLGSRLLSALLREVRNKQPTRIILDVRTQNYQAISFYETHDFYSIGTRRNFYSNPADDSLVMQCDLTTEPYTNT
jgi:[ribosomal protein S18]-alanine N-acetyltransferase